MTLLCPECARTLEGPETLPRCPEGHGEMLPRATAEESLPWALPGLDAVLGRGAPARRMCPRCHEHTMRRGPVKGSRRKVRAGPISMRVWYVLQDVDVDGCPACAVFWLDAGKLAALDEAIRVDPVYSRKGEAPPLAIVPARRPLAEEPRSPPDPPPVRLIRLVVGAALFPLGVALLLGGLVLVSRFWSDVGAVLAVMGAFQLASAVAGRRLRDDRRPER